MRIVMHILLLILLLVFPYQLKSDELKKLPSEHEINFYSGMFDFSDDGKKSTIIGLQHQNENLIRESFLGTLSPVTGALITADNAAYFYSGVQAQYKIGKINLSYLILRLNTRIKVRSIISCNHGSCDWG